MKLPILFPHEIVGFAHCFYFLIATSYNLLQNCCICFFENAHDFLINYLLLGFILFELCSGCYFSFLEILLVPMTLCSSNSVYLLLQNFFLPLLLNNDLVEGFIFEILLFFPLPFLIS